ncbi:hypothetical protein ACFE04_021405 [Oxalis oulophora]
MEYCKNHPDHKQLKGVCPFCLRDKLSKLDYAPTVVLFSNKFTTSASNSASASSTCDSPVLCRGGGRRRSRHNRSDMLSSMSLKLSRIANHRDENNNNNNNNNRLKKSKSITFISSKKNCEVKNVTNNNKKLKKDGFWSKFINSSKGNNSSFNSRRDQVLIQHPKTVSLRLF